MQARMSNPAQIIPETMKAIQALNAATGKGAVPRSTLDIVHLRVSRINGCSACVDSGSRGAGKAGEIAWIEGLNRIDDGRVTAAVAVA